MDESKQAIRSPNIALCRPDDDRKKERSQKDIRQWVGPGGAKKHQRNNDQSDQDWLLDPPTIPHFQRDHYTEKEFAKSHHWVGIGEGLKKSA